MKLSEVGGSSWVAYDEHHRYWSGTYGGKSPKAAYREFINSGLKMPADPKMDRLRDWVYGSEDFLKRVLSMAKGEEPSAHRRRVRRLSPVSVNDIISATASQFDTTAEAYRGFRSNAPGRDLAAYLCRRYTRATLQELSARCGLSHPDSASDLIRRGAKRLEQSKQMMCHVNEIEEKLRLNPESRV